MALALCKIVYSSLSDRFIRAGKPEQLTLNKLMKLQALELIEIAHPTGGHPGGLRSCLPRNTQAPNFDTKQYGKHNKTTFICL